MGSNTTTDVTSSQPDGGGGKRSNFVFLYRSPIAKELVRRHPNALRLLTAIALEAQRVDGFPRAQLKAGQCFIHGAAEVGMTDQQYRTAKQALCNQFNLVTAEARSKGTVFTLVSTEVFDINIKLGSEATNEHPGRDQRPTPEQARRKIEVGATSKTPQPRPISTGEICVSALAGNEQESASDNEQANAITTSSPEKLNTQATSSENAKPASDPYKQRVEAMSVEAAQEEKKSFKKKELSKLIGYKREGSDFNGRKPIKLDDDELRDCPAFKTHAEFVDWLFSIEEIYTTQRMGVVTEGTWLESFGGTLWRCYQSDPASFIAAWNEILYRLRDPASESNPKTRIRRIGAAFFDYFQTIQNPATKPKAVA